MARIAQITARVVLREGSISGLSLLAKSELHFVHKSFPAMRFNILPLHRRRTCSAHGFWHSLKDFTSDASFSERPLASFAIVRCAYRAGISLLHFAKTAKQ
jgi:hypothetical protein